MGSSQKALERPIGPGSPELMIFRPLVSDHPWQKCNPSSWNLFQTSMNVLPTRLRRMPSPSASTCVIIMLVATSVPAVQAMNFRRMGFPARVRLGDVRGEAEAEHGLAVPTGESPGDPFPALFSQLSAVVSCTQSHQATCPAWSTLSPTLLNYAATTASVWSEATPSTSSSWSLLKSMTTSKYTAPMTSYRYSHSTSKETPPSPSYPLLALLIPAAFWILWPIGSGITNITHGLGKLPHNWKWIQGIPFPLQLKTCTKQDSHHHHHHPGTVGKYLPWGDDPPSSPTRSMPMGGILVSSVGSKSLLTLTPAATPWICCSSQTTQGTAVAGSCTTLLKVRGSGGLPCQPAMWQDQVGKKKASDSEINMPSDLPRSHQVPPA